jgi:4,5-dihydroxyphthalate decarboxylase
MSISTYFIAKERGIGDMVGVPVFPNRRFMQTELSYHVDSGIKEAKDLVDKKVGIEEYQQSAAVWTRGILEHDFGVSQYKVHWYMERSEEFSHGGATGFKPPQGISFNRLPENKSLASMLVHHELDVAVVQKRFERETNIIDKTTHIRGDEGDWSKVKPVFPDMIAEGERYYKKHGYIPANNVYVIRGELYRQHPWLAFNLYDAFEKSKVWAYDHLSENIPLNLIFGPQYLAKTREIFGPDPFPYGIRKNVTMLNTFLDYALEQGLLSRRPKLEDSFAPSTVEL